jgi:hypothetical protein
MWQADKYGRAHKLFFTHQHEEHIKTLNDSTGDIHSMGRVIGREIYN